MGARLHRLRLVRLVLRAECGVAAGLVLDRSSRFRPIVLRLLAWDDPD